LLRESTWLTVSSRRTLQSFDSPWFSIRLEIQWTMLYKVAKAKISNLFKQLCYLELSLLSKICIT
jgi:hypothetical protein